MRAVAMRSGIPVRSFQGILEGQQPSIGRAAEICRALGLEFYIGTPRGEGGSEPSQAPAATADHPPLSEDPTASFAAVVREEVAGAVRAETQALRAELSRLKPARDDLEDADALVHLGDGFGKTQETRQIEIAQYAAAAGGGAEEAEERIVGTLAFCRQWIDRHALRPGSCAVIDVRGESMEPTLWNGASILFDRSRGEWRPGDIFVIRIPDQGLVVKRAGENEAGNRQLLSDHPAWEPAPYPDDAEIIGQVVWTARTLIGQLR